MKHGYAGYTNGACRCEVCKEGQVAYAREYKQRPGVKKRQRAYQAKYRTLKREEKLTYGREYKTRCADELRAKERAFKKTPAGKAKARKDHANRRGRKVGGFVENVDPRMVWEMHGGCCGICHQFVSLEEFHVDHVIPLSRGGLHGYINCQPAHARCNLSKGAKLAA